MWQKAFRHIGEGLPVYGRRASGIWVKAFRYVGEGLRVYEGTSSCTYREAMIAEHRKPLY
jgi:hypothetical protein